MKIDPSGGATRIDKWLWAARAYKSRSMAAEACDGGKVTINANRAKPHKLVRPGDLVAFRAGTVDKSWKVIEIAERRGPASFAQTLYEDLTPPPPPRPPGEDQQPWRYTSPQIDGGRPDKRQRRQLERIRRRGAGRQNREDG
jgi:ribosome-associated heat shock protein Hsp15